jgi:uncharacterized protein YcbX
MRVTDIIIYPIKGCQGYSLKSVAVTAMGLVGDREFTLVHEGAWANQKQIPDLYKLGAVWQGTDLILRYPARPDFTLPTKSTGAESPLTVYGQEVPVLDMGDGVGQWLSAVLDLPVRLVRAKAPFDWYLPLEEFVKVHGEKQSKFVDTSPVLMINLASLEDLNQRLNNPVTMDRFRANIVVTDLQPYEENDLDQCVFAHLNLDQVAPCERCTVVTLDQSTGVRTKEPLLTLSGYRRRPNDYAGGIVFGAYFTPVLEGRLAVGDISR